MKDGNLTTYLTKRWSAGFDNIKLYRSVTCRVHHHKKEPCARHPAISHCLRCTVYLIRFTWNFTPIIMLYLEKCVVSKSRRYSTRLLISGRNPNCENRSVCERRDIYFRDSALLILRQGIVRYTSSNFDAPTNQNTCYKKVAL